MRMTRGRIDRHPDEQLIGHLSLLFFEQQIGDFFSTSVMEAKSRIVQFPKRRDRNGSEHRLERLRTYHPRSLGTDEKELLVL